MARPRIKIGRLKVGRLKIIGDAGVDRSGNQLVRCLCRCSKGTTLGRILDAAVPGYCRKNCEWQTKLQQGAERRGKNAAKLLHTFHARQKPKAA
jgi:hypothetical protein